MGKAPAHLTRRRPHFFRPVPVRARRDGWSVQRQCAFLTQLYVTGSVAEAARLVGMTRASAYRLRSRKDANSFARAWDSVLARPGTGKLPPLEPATSKVTLAALKRRVDCGLVRPVVYRGDMIAIRRKPDNSALLKLLSRAGRARKKAASESSV